MSESSSSLRLWYRQPAARWEEALPIGNGMMGAMIFGGIERERIQFNEETLWTGRPRDYLRAGARDALPPIQQLIFANQPDAAAELVRAKFLSDPVRQKAYQPFGDLHLSFPEQWGTSDYVRQLDLQRAVATTTFTAAGVRHTREAFASYPARAIVLRLSASAPGQVSFSARLATPHRRSRAMLISADTIAINGQVQDNIPPHELGLQFEARLRAVVEGGRLVCGNDGTITVEAADRVTLLLVAATSFVNFDDISADPAGRCAERLAALGSCDYEQLKQSHEADHRRLFDAFSIDLGGPADDQPTDVRLNQLTARVQSTEPAGSAVTAALAADPALAALYTQFGRYLLIASSRPGGEPANLQGVWNQLPSPPWESKYTTNINLLMNYWPANLAGLAECEAPLFDLIDDLRITGAKVAREQYNARGWVLHHNTDLWRGATPINNIDGMWPTGAAWLCWHLWEHFRFTLDFAFLAQRAYPAMVEACEFFLDTLVPDPATGRLVTCPSHSPEQGPLCAGPAMDMQLLRALFDATIEAAHLLNADSEWPLKLKEARSQLAPDRIGRHGQLQEWQQDIDEPDNTHRHLSPLWGLYPGEQFTPETPELFEAAKVLMRWRGDGSTGWSFAWRMPMWARAGDGAMAARQLALQLARKTLPNFFDLCGPFQVDGNFGAVAGVAEMLVQSHRRDGRGRTIVELLPALPACWPAGAVRGIGAHGRLKVDLRWADRCLQHARIHAAVEQAIVIRHRTIDLEKTFQPGEAFDYSPT